VLTFEQIKELIDLVAAHRLSGIELERSGFRLRVDGYKAAKLSAPVAVPAAAPPAAVEPPPSQPPAEAAAPVPEQGTDAHVVTSPIVGTFFRAPNPEAPPFVEVGSRVKQGQVLCIVEAMKLMNEIESDVDGVVVEIFPKNAQPVEYGEPLFAVKTD
jgi:acetyl-CoA carboxylase biotin carboxyl carrier protein